MLRIADHGRALTRPVKHNAQAVDGGYRVRVGVRAVEELPVIVERDVIVRQVRVLPAVVPARGNSTRSEPEGWGTRRGATPRGAGLVAQLGALQTPDPVAPPTQLSTSLHNALQRSATFDNAPTSSCPPPPPRKPPALSFSATQPSHPPTLAQRLLRTPVLSPKTHIPDP